MNGKAAKRLRKIARSLQLSPDTAYGLTYHPDPNGDWQGDGEIRRRPTRLVPDPVTGKREPQKGPPIRRMIVMGECERRAVKEGKKLYHGK